MELLTLLAAGLANGSIYALIALGLVIIYKTQDMVQFAHGDLFMVGAYAGLISHVVLGFPYLLAFMFAVVFTACVGMLIERTMFRPLMDEPHLTLVMLTVGLSFVLKGIARLLYGDDIMAFPPILTNEPIVWLGLVLSSQSVAVVVATVFLTASLYLLFRFTTLGKQMRGAASNLLGARVVGVNIGRVYLTTWGLAAGIGAAAGFLAGPITLVYPEMGSKALIKGFAAAVLGGFGSIPGAVVGGFSVGIMELLCGLYISTAVMEVSSFAIIMLILIFLPRGLFGATDEKRV
jgi:branched-chain amino acid transport system permease protein